MIRRLHLQGWRAFDDVTLDLDQGLTFVVAENGVGKTSLVQATSWGLYGSVSLVDARAARRVGADRTIVEVDVELPDGRMLAITREVHDRAESMHARLDGRDLDEDELSQAMAQAFGASREFLSMTTVVPSDAVANDTAGGFQLQAHLRRVFGVDDLQRAADALQQLHDHADADARKARQTTRRATADLHRLRTELAEAEVTESSARAARTEARQVLAFAEDQLRAAREQAATLADVATTRKEFAELLATTRRTLGRGARLGRVTRAADLAVYLETAEIAAADALDGLRQHAATIEGRLAVARAAAASLHDADAECPVCRRGLSTNDIERAEQTHQRELEALVAQKTAVASEVESATRRLGELRTLGRRAVRLPATAPPIDEVALDVDTAAFAVEAAARDTERRDDEAALARARRDLLANQVREEDQILGQTLEAAAAHRRAAVANVAAEVMRATAEAILTERIDPLAVEVGHRWKRVFGERGALQLRADGQLVLIRGVHEIPFSQFSSGEKVVALLATRLLVLGASTRASFLWLDEPLEHLDPRNRRITASLMTAAGRQVRQILVTTYEEALARRLSSVASAQLRYVRAPEG